MKGGGLSGAWHGFWRSSPGVLAWRIGIGVLGLAIVLAGLAMLALPGPGWLVIFAGLAVLGIEFVWAKRVLGFARAKVDAWTGFVMRQPLPIRLLIGLSGIVLVCLFAYGFLWAFGVPAWVPSFAGDPVRAMLPGS